MYRIRNSGASSDRSELKLREAKSVAAAVEALARLHHQETKAKLQRFVSQKKAEEDPLAILHSRDFLNTRDPLFWYSCFVRLFPRGDCGEKDSGRLTRLLPGRWIKALLTRADAPLWRQDVSQILVVYL